MTDADKKQFLTLMMGVAENFTAQLSKPGIAMRFEALREFPIEQVRDACTAIVTTRKFSKMPTIAEFMEYLGGGSVDDIAAIEAAKVLRAIKSIGGYRSVAFDNATTQAVIEYGFGGWAKVCAEMEADKEHWFLKDFAKTYGAYSRQGVKLVGPLAGRTEIGNSAMWAGHNSSVELVGDQGKALAIAQAAADQPKRGIGPVDMRTGLLAVVDNLRSEAPLDAA